ncbi:MAG: hypothetical protein ACKOAI_01110, partial [Acidimicrobiia bacterium]
SCVFVGEFAQRHRDEIMESLGMVPWKYEFASTSGSANASGAGGFPHARHVALIAHRRLIGGDPAHQVDGDSAHLVGDDSAQLVPSIAAMYLREADAEINWRTRAS